MAAGHVDPTIKATVVANTVNDAVIDAPAILAWRNDVADKVDSNYDDTQTKLAAKATVTTGTGSPIGVVTPTIIGQTYTDRTSGLVYTATALANTAWIIPAPYNFMTQQAIINAAMEVWQTGTTFTNPASNSYSADMWVIDILGTGTLPTTIIHSRATLTSGELFNSKYAYNINVNGAGSAFGSVFGYNVRQRIENGTSKLCGNGKKITVSFYAKSSIGGKRIAVACEQYYGTGGSPSSQDQLVPTSTTIRSVTSTMALYTFTFTTNTLVGKTFGTNNDDYLMVGIYFAWGSSTATVIFGGGTAETFVGSGNITFTEVVVNAGDVALPFQPKSFSQELFDCQRYYEKSYVYATPPATATSLLGLTTVFVGSSVANSSIMAKIRFRVQKRTIPSIIVYPYTTPSNTGRVSDAGATDLAAGSGATNYIGDEGFSVLNGSGGALTPAANAIFFHWTADARL